MHTNLKIRTRPLTVAEHVASVSRQRGKGGATKVFSLLQITCFWKWFDLWFDLLEWLVLEVIWFDLWFDLVCLCNGQKLTVCVHNIPKGSIRTVFHVHVDRPAKNEFCSFTTRHFQLPKPLRSLLILEPREIQRSIEAMILGMLTT